MRAILGVLVSALLVAGCAGATGSAAPSASAPAPSTPALGSVRRRHRTQPHRRHQAATPSRAASCGTVQFEDDGAPVTTQVDVVADGGRVRYGRHDVPRRHPHSRSLCHQGRRYMGRRRQDRADHGLRREGRRLVGGHRQGGPPCASAIWLSDTPRRPATATSLASTDFANIGVENLARWSLGSWCPRRRPERERRLYGDEP